MLLSTFYIHLSVFYKFLIFQVAFQAVFWYNKNGKQDKSFRKEGKTPFVSQINALSTTSEERISLTPSTEDGTQEIKVIKMSIFDSYKKTKDLLICVDSDGCAMDTMNCKHFHCFGPRMVDEWNLHQWSDEILKRWNEINLYQMTRGINRFAGLAMALTEINEKYTKIDGIEALNHWVKNTRALSNGAIKEAAEALPRGNERTCLEKALSWSNAVNRSIIDLPRELKIPFNGAKEGLAAAHKIADVAVVSSANRGAVEEEWEEHNLLPQVDILLAQDVGTKAFCIKEMLNFGYDKEKTLMIGDAVGDMEAADKNGVYFFPILVNHEKESWEELIKDALPRLKNNTFGGEYQADLKARFIKNLGG